MIKVKDIENGKYFKKCPTSKVIYEKLHFHNPFNKNSFQCRQVTYENGDEKPFEDSIYWNGNGKVFLAGA